MRSGSLLFAVLVTAPAARATELLYRQTSDNQSRIPSAAVPSAGTSVEAADDFDLVGAIERVGVDADVCFSCAIPGIEGAWVRFYEWTPTDPGALQYEEYVPRGDARLIADPESLGGVEVTLATPFQASGRHYVSIQLQTNAASPFAVQSANWQNPADRRVRWRDRAAGTPWQDYFDATGPHHCDLAFELWGTDATPPPAGTDPCGPWEITPFPMPTNSGHFRLTDVHATGPNEAWAVGNVSVLYASNAAKQLGAAARWDGTQWSLVPTPNPEPYANAGGVYLEAIDGLVPNDLWAVGMRLAQNQAGFTGPQVLALRWNGTSWSQHPTPVTVNGNSYANDVEVIAPNDVWVVGQWWAPNSQGGGYWSALAMRWNGSQWTVYPTPAPFTGTPGFELEAIDAVASDDVWAVGHGSDGDPSGQPYILHWDGSAWSYTPAPVPTGYNSLTDVVAIAHDDVWAVGGTNFTYEPLVLHWNGSAWTRIAVTRGGGSLEIDAPDRVYIGGSALSYGSASGFSVVESFASVDAPSIAALDSASECATWAVGRRIAAGMIVPFAARVHVSEGESRCAGDGGGTACPCGNTGGPGRGCANSASPTGAALAASGAPRVSGDTLTLRAEGLPNSSSALFFQGTTDLGAGVVFGDGVRCVGGSVVRLGTRTASAGIVALGDAIAGDAPISALGIVPPAGGARHYQVWYRNPAAFCTPSTFNLTNGWSLTWVP